jgi:hypothetical protein
VYMVNPTPHPDGQQYSDGAGPPSPAIPAAMELSRDVFVPEQDDSVGSRQRAAEPGQRAAESNSADVPARGTKSGIRGTKSGIRGTKSGIRGTKSGIRGTSVSGQLQRKRLKKFKRKAWFAIGYAAAGIIVSWFVRQIYLGWY